MDSASLLAFAAVGAMAIACAVLSVFVVARRWAFIGEGIGHSGFGGAGTAWLMMLIFPSLVNQTWVTYLAVVVFCIATALAIGYVSRGRRVSTDTAIGIFMVASLAWGFLAQQIFRQVMGAEPAGFGEILFGRFSGLAPKYALAVIAVSVAVVVTLIGLGKEIVYYCLDPLSAEASGVPAGFVHYLLMVLIAMTVIIGIPVTGSPLVTALLVLPGAIANLVTDKLRNVIGIAILASLIAAGVGLCASRRWGGVYVPAGPAIVLVLFMTFVVVYGAVKITRAGQE